MAPTTILGYWNIRGAAQPIRNLLEYAGQEYENRTYEYDTSDMTNLPQVMGNWMKVKTTCPLLVGGEGETAMDFPNLPYFIEKQPDGTTLKLTQSRAILKHLARKYVLVVEGENNIARMEMYELQIVDFAKAVVGYSFDNAFLNNKYPNYLVDIKEHLKQWDKLLDGKRWLMGDKLTYVDFLLYEMLDWHDLMNAGLFDKTPNLKAFLDRFRALPNIAIYFASGRYRPWPPLSPFATKFGWIKSD